MNRDGNGQSMWGAAGAKSCAVEHVGMVVSGRATAAMDDGRVIEMRAGDVFYISPGHDSWVVGDEPYVSFHFFGAERYAAGEKGSVGRGRGGEGGGPLGNGGPASHG